MLSSTKEILENLITDEAPQKALIAIGYSGWGAGQIESEIAANVWMVAEADEALLFDTDYETKWARALKTLGIKPEMLSAFGGTA